MEKAYIHSNFEDNIYQKWQAAGAFSPDTQKNIDPTQKPYTIMMPPPNANDPLHIGHAMFTTLEDILIRHHRMLGRPTLWLPGTDHAGIETQFVFEKKLKKDGKSRFQFDRETLFKMIWDDVQQNSNIAVDQLKRMGASADWSRFTFMLDEELVKVVLQTFGKMSDKGLIYRDYRLVNFCPKCGTAFSELEVNHVEQKRPMYYMKYGPFTIATARPETKFRDTALAANPSDPRYKDWMGKTLDIPGLLGPITMTVIADEDVDPEFGTGIMKVTPAHDPHDFELGKKYNLPIQPIIDTQGKMDFSWFFEKAQNETIEEKYLERARKYHGKKVLEARSLMVEDLKQDGLLVKVDENYTNSVGVCYRCQTIIEPLPLPQFFIKVKPLTQKALEALAQSETVVYGAGHDKILQHWLTNLKDWNISRQIVWGIRMPIWYHVVENPELSVTFLDPQGQKVRGTLSEILRNGHTLDEIKKGLQELRAPMNASYVVSVESPGEKFIQETDTFDTWFSSAQWPVSTLLAQDNKNNRQDFARFYPTQVMETGYDILPFWVMRMLMVGLFMTDQVPFERVYLHGLVRDQKGQKMSKSKGNVINPLTIIDKYGADALRMALVIRSSVGLDKSVGEGDFKAMRNFTNKIWNAARFLISNSEKAPKTTASSSSSSQEYHTRLNQLIKDVTQQLTDLKIGLAAETLFNEFWHWFCDECIEQGKTGALSQEDLLFGLLQFLKLLHPFVPFVTEAVWQELRRELGEKLAVDSNITKMLSEELLITASWPEISAT